MKFVSSTKAKKILAEYFGLFGKRRRFPVENTPPLTCVIVEGGEPTAVN